MHQQSHNKLSFENIARLTGQNGHGVCIQARPEPLLADSPFGGSVNGGFLYYDIKAESLRDQDPN